MLVSNYKIEFHTFKNTIYKIMLDDVEIEFDCTYYNNNIDGKLIIDVMLVYKTSYALKVFTYQYKPDGNLIYDEQTLTINNTEYSLNNYIEFSV